MSSATSTAPAPRRFLPEPVETSTRSFKHSPAEAKAEQSEGKARRFLPQPVEESTRSSRKARLHTEEDNPVTGQQSRIDGTHANPLKKISGEPAEPPPRRSFAPQLIETSSRNTKKKFAPEPVETSTRSSKDKKVGESSASPVVTRRFVPEPVETSSSRRRRKEPEPEEDSTTGPPAPETPETPERTASGGRRFSPELLETARASYKRNRVASRSKSPKKDRDSTSSSAAEDEPSDPHESRFSAAALSRRQHVENRRHTFSVPNLPVIESDPSEDSDPPSLSETPSASSLESFRQRVQATRDEINHTDDVLRLAAKTKSDKQIQDIAMSAYINERPHQPVEHFAVDHDDDEDGPIYVGRLQAKDGTNPTVFRRDSATDLSWELQNMQQHHAQLERAKHDLEANTVGTSRFSAAALAMRQHHGQHYEVRTKKPAKEQKKKEKDTELAKMRMAASPPMLGDDLVFPQSLSPKMTRCDVDQIPIPRNNEDNQDNNAAGEKDGDPQLWSVHVNASDQAGAGLWMGLCQQPEDLTQPPTPLRSGLQTPAFDPRTTVDGETPHRPPGTPGRRFARPAFANISMLPLTPPKEDPEDSFTTRIDAKLNLEREIDAEFPPAVVTQIYNYLSLGYPSLAHQFDDELSKISRIPVDELRKDDYNTNAKGHVNAPEGDGVAEEAVLGGRCKRWEALRLYCREWYRQRPLMAERENGDWGARVRRGSWAW